MGHRVLVLVLSDAMLLWGAVLAWGTTDRIILSRYARSPRLPKKTFTLIVASTADTWWIVNAGM